MNIPALTSEPPIHVADFGPVLTRFPGLTAAMYKSCVQGAHATCLRIIPYLAQRYGCALPVVQRRVTYGFAIRVLTAGMAGMPLDTLA